MRRRIRGESATFELNDHDLSVKIGKATLLVSAYNGDVPGVLVADDIGANEAVLHELGLDYTPPTQSQIAPRGALLRLGEAVRIGKTRGVEILNQRGEVDAERHKLYDWLVLEAILRADRYISRTHAEITAIGGWMATVHDLDSTNGTILEVILPTDDIA